MEAEYRRDAHHSYLVLSDTEQQKDSFQVRMFLENSIPGFLPCRMYDIDCSGRFFYDISSRQSLVSILETKPLDHRSLEALIEALLRALGELQRYLLDADGFCLRPEWVFCRPDSTDFEFCYFPGGFQWKEQLKLLAEFILPRLEHKNKEAVQLGYDFYQQVMEEKIAASELEQLLQNNRRETESRGKAEMQEESLFPVSRNRKGGEDREEVPVSRDDLLSSFFEEEKPAEKERRKRHLLPLSLEISGEMQTLLEWILPLAAGSAGTFLFWYLGYDAAACMLAFLTVAAIAAVRLRRWKREKDQEREQTMEQYVQIQDWLEEEKEEERFLQEKESGKEGTAFAEEEDENATCLLASEEVYSRLAKGYLIPEAGRDGVPVAVDQELTMIGKSSQMDVILKEIGISRIHARIVCKGEDCFLSDLNSRNGTRVNGELLKPEEERILTDGDKISFANLQFEWRCYRL